MTTGNDDSTADYLAAFALKCEPFADAVDSRFFYGGSALIQRLDLLTHLTQFGDAVIFVSGPTGSGKTTLLSRFVAQANSQWRLCLMDAGEFGDFPARLADALRSGEPGDETEQLERWAANTDNSQLLVIVIDNAEQLDDEDFRRLCRLLAQPAADRVRIVMFGLPDAQQRHKQALEQQQLNCTAQQLDMPRLSEEETASYLMYRLAVAGYSGESPFSATEVAAMCKAADGRPAMINRLAHDALSERQARARGKRIRRKGGRRGGTAPVLGALAVALLAAAGWLAWQQLQPGEPAGNTPVPMQDIPLALPEPRPLTPEPATAEPPEPTPPATPPMAETAPEPEPALPEPAAPAKTPESPPVTDSEPPPAEDGQTAPDTETPAEPPVATVAQPLAEPAPVPAGDTPLADTPAPVQETPAPAAQPDTPPAPASAEPPAATATADTGELPHRESWLLAQPAGSYTLQLLGSRHADSITDYIRQHRLDPQQAAFYRGRYKGGEWYVLLYGNYPSRQAALDARTGLPAAVRQAKPWPRSFASVHKAIGEAR